MSNSWVFSRLPGRDYLWQPGKPQLSFEMLAWLESLPPVLVGTRRSSDLPRIFFRFFKDSFVYEGFACLAEAKDEFGRQTAEVRIEEGIRVRRAATSTDDPLSRDLVALKSAVYSKRWETVISDSLQYLREQGLSYYFGPDVCFPAAFIPAVSVTEAGAKINYFVEKKSQDLEFSGRDIESLPTSSVAKGMVGRFVDGTLRAFSGGSVADSHFGGDVLLVLKRKSISYTELEFNGRVVAKLNEQETQRLIRVIKALTQE